MEESTQSSKAYLKALRDDQLLIVMEHSFKEKKGEKALRSFGILMKRWAADGAPGALLADILENKSKPEALRLCILEYLRNNAEDVRDVKARGDIRDVLANISDDPRESAVVRDYATRGLGGFKDDKSMNRLIAKLDSRDSSTVDSAVRGLRRFRRRDQRPAIHLIRMLERYLDNMNPSDKAQQRTIYSAVAAVGDFEHERIPGVLMKAAEKVEGRNDPEAYDIRMAAFYALAQIGRREDVAFILSHYARNPDLVHQARLPTHLFNEHHANARKELLNMLVGAPDDELMPAAITMIAQIYALTREIPPGLMEKLKSPNKEVKIAAVKALKRINAISARETLLEMRKTEQDRDVLGWIDSALANIKESR